MLTRKGACLIAGLVALLGMVCVPSAGVGASETSYRAQAPAEEPPQMLLIHGYGDATEGKDCNQSTWRDALSYYQVHGGRDRGSMSTIGYYVGDEQAHDVNRPGCDVIIGDTECDGTCHGQATNERPIQDIARDFANYIYDTYTSNGHPVDIVAHSMGGLISRVAILGSAEGWTDFPPRLDVEDVVTLGTPHQGVLCDDDLGDGANSCPDTRQWLQMDPDSNFVDKLHESEPGADDRGFDDPWADGTDWSLVGADDDETVSEDSAIDKGYHADQKYRYTADVEPDGGAEDSCANDPEVNHAKIRELIGAGGFCLRYWHAWGDHDPHDTYDGWSPLKTAFKAASYQGDDLPG